MTAANKLRQFRQCCEKEANTTATEIEVPLAHVLDDVCRLLGLSNRERDRVLGRKSATLLKRALESRIELKP